jgi:hypothetical protein
MNAHDKTVNTTASTPNTHTPAAVGGCCGTPAQTKQEQVDATASTAPCCGTSKQAETEGTCCGTSAKTEAVAAGATCCG